MSVFSHSRLESFETCPKKYEFAYVLRLPRGPAGIEAFLGSRVHEALEWLYSEVRMCRVPDEEDVVERYRAAWADEWSDEVKVVRADWTATDYQAVGEKAVRRYYRRYHPFDQGDTVGLEMRVKFALDQDHEIVGYIDRLVKVSDGVWEIHDYKTSAQLMTQEKAEADRQLALYDLAVRRAYPDASEVRLVWHYLAHDHEVRSCRSEAQLVDLRAQVLDEVRHIEAQATFPTKPSKLCDWCDYRPSCPAWADLYRAEEEPQREGPAPDSSQLVDDYATCSEQISEARSRLAGLREAIIVRAADEGVERLFGTGRVAAVRHAAAVVLPSPGDPAREELEQALSDLGLSRRYLQLATGALAHDLTAGLVSPEAAARLGPFTTPSESVKVTVSRLE